MEKITKILSMVVILAVMLLLTACGEKPLAPTEEELASEATQAVKETTIPETTVPETEPPVPDLEINADVFPDENFRKFLLSQDYGEDGVLTDEEIQKITEMDCRNQEIESLDGIGAFYALVSLDCGENKLEYLDMSGNAELEILVCGLNRDESKRPNSDHMRLKVLNVTENPKLKYLDCALCMNLESLDVTHNPDLEYLNCWSCHLEELDLSKNEKLIELVCSGNEFGLVDVSNNLNLRKLEYDGSLTEALDLTKHTQIETSTSCGCGTLGSVGP